MFANIRRRQCHAFTMVELLVVISMIVLLIALLLPSLQVALKEAAKAHCLSRVRGLGQSTVMYAMDNKLQLPAPILNYLTGDRTPTDYQYVQSGKVGQLYDIGSGTKYFMPAGTMALFGYISDPKMLFCPTFIRTTAQNNNWDTPSGTNTIWKAVTNGSTNLLVDSGNNNNAYMGYSEHFYASASNAEVTGPAGSNARRGVQRLDYVEAYWNKRPEWGVNSTQTRGWYSPMFWTCGNINEGNAAYPDISVRNNCHIGSQGGTIIREGFNTVFFDGSARWISRAESFKLGGTNFFGADTGYALDWMSFHYPGVGSGHRWGRNYAVLTAPR